MKTRLHHALIIVLILAQACTTASRVQVMHPAEIDVPKTVQKVVLVNRYKPTGKNTWINVLEGLFTGEMVMADRRGADQALNGLMDGLRNSPRYEVVMANTEMPGNGLGLFPEPLAPAQVQSLCKQYKADALLAIEAFDSNVSVATQPKTRTQKQNGKEVTVTYFEGRETVGVTIGWRIYSAESGAVLDQNQVYKTLYFNSEGSTKQQAIANLVFPADAVARTGYDGGWLYAGRIAPSWVWVSREFYGSGSTGMRKAKKMAKRGDWENAAVLWKSLTKSEKTKVAKRATYNMAVAAEMMGNYDIAIEWARKAANTYNLRRADNYIYTLKNQKAALDRVNQQLAPADSTGR